MKKSVSIFLLTMVVTVSISGCSIGKISNDKIAISQYKQLTVDDKATAYEEEVWNALMKNCVLKTYSQKELEELMEELEKQYSYVAYYKDMTALELIEEQHGMTIEEYAKELMKKEYAIDLIAEKEQLTLSQEEYEIKLAEKAKSNGLETEEYESMFGQEKLKKMFLEERVLNFLIKNSK